MATDEDLKKAESTAADADEAEAEVRSSAPPDALCSCFGNR